MKRIKQIAVYSFCTLLVCVSCTGEHHDKIIRDSEGNVYQLDHRVGKCYYLKKIDTKAMKDIINAN